jgi:hypothetical protein
MAYERSEMLYDDGTYYKWKAREDHDNPYYRAGTDHSELNKTEGYEVLYFINHLGQKWNWTNSKGEAVKEVSLPTYQKIERLIREAPPKSTHKRVAQYIRENWNK